MRPDCTRDANSRLTVRASGEWLRWAAGFARHLGVDRSVLVTKAVEEFAEVRQYHREPPRRYVRALFFDKITGAWVEEPPVLNRGEHQPLPEPPEVHTEKPSVLPDT